MGSERRGETAGSRGATRLQDAEYRRAFRAAARAVASRRPGRDRSVVRRALEEELQRRGVADPEPRDLETVAEVVREGQGRLAPFRLARKAWRDLAEARAILKESGGPDWLRPPDGVNVLGEGASAAAVRVRLVEEAQPFLAKAFEALYDPEWDDDDEVAHAVWIDARGGRADESLRVFLGTELVGELDGKGAQALSRPLAEAARKRKPLVLEGFLDREKGRISLWVNVPAPGRP